MRYILIDLFEALGGVLLLLVNRILGRRDYPLRRLAVLHFGVALGRDFRGIIGDLIAVLSAILTLLLSLLQYIAVENLLLLFHLMQNLRIKCLLLLLLLSPSLCLVELGRATL